MRTRVARLRGAQQVTGIGLVPERLDRAWRNGVTALDLRENSNDLPRSHGI
jgi:hypothetical protein